MPRVAEGREPAVPTSPSQRQRYHRILRAAAEHGATQAFDRIQMLDVAKDAGVAIATLYRYFPSKTILYTSVMMSQVEQLDRASAPVRPGQLPSEAVARVLIEAGNKLLRRPLLAQAMLQSNNVAIAGEPIGPMATNAFANLILRVAGLSEPTEHQLRLVRLIEQTWYGVLISQLNGHIGPEDAEADTLLACRLLLADFDSDETARVSAEPEMGVSTSR